MSSWSCANNTWPSAKLSVYTYMFWIVVPNVWPFLFQFINTRSGCILYRVGDKLHSCFNLLISLKTLVIKFPIFIFELVPLCNDFIPSINRVLMVDSFRDSHNVFNGALSYAFVKSKNNKYNSLLVVFVFVSLVLYKTFIYGQTSISNTWLFFHFHILLNVLVTAILL